MSDELVNKPITLSMFKQLKVYKKYTPLTFQQILLFMKQHKDIYLVTDTKLTDSKDIKSQFNELVKEAKEVDGLILNRIIPQIYYEAMLPQVKNIYNFNNIIYTLYATDSSDEDVLAFAIKNNVKVITMSTQRFSKEFVEKLSENGIYSYVHTINSLSEIERYKKDGVHCFYTDFILPSDFKYINVN